MNYNEVKEYVKKAFENDEVEKLLLEEDEYELPYPYQFNVSLNAKDYDRVFEEVNEFLKENNSEENIKKFENAMLKLSNGKPFHAWVAFTCFYVWKVLENKNKAAFSLKKEIQKNVRKGIEKNKESLKTHHLFRDDTNKTYMEDIKYFYDEYQKKYNKKLL